MIREILGALFCAWVLAFFGFDCFILRIVNGFFHTNYGTEAYYMAAIVLAIIDRIFRHSLWIF